MTLKRVFWCPVCTSNISVVSISMNHHRYSCEMLILPLILMSDVRSLSGMSGLSFDSTFLPAFLWFFLPLLLFLSSFFFCYWASLLFPEMSSVFIFLLHFIYGQLLSLKHCRVWNQAKQKYHSNKICLKEHVFGMTCWTIEFVCVKRAVFVSGKQSIYSVCAMNHMLFA